MDKLIDSNKNYKKEGEGTTIYDICAINEDEIVLKIGDEILQSRYCKLSVINKDYLAISYNSIENKFILIDLKIGE